MLDINLIREKPQQVRAALLKRMDEVDFTELLEWDKQRRSIIFDAESLKAKRNKVSAEIPKLKKEGRNIQQLLDEMKSIAEKIKEQDTLITQLDNQINNFLVGLPNIPAEDVKAGGKENNEVVRVWGQKPEFKYKPKNHVDLVCNLGLIDYERGVKLGGNGFWIYKGEGALIEWALLNYFIEEHIKDGYEFILPPHILTWQCG